MLAYKFEQLQIELLQSVNVMDMSPKAFIRFGRNMLYSLRKAKAYLREEPTNKHWALVKELVLAHILTISTCLPSYIADLDPTEEHMLLSFYELVTSCTQVAYEEFKLDEEASLHDIEDKPVMSKEQLEALLSIDE